MDAQDTKRPNPRRVAAGKRNRAKRKGLTPEGRGKLRQSALRHKPWRFSSGPKTPEGKAIPCNKENKLLMMHGSIEFNQFVNGKLEIMAEQKTERDEEQEKN